MYKNAHILYQVAFIVYHDLLHAIQYLKIDNLDNDRDDLCDCADPDCDSWFEEICVKPEDECKDGIDNNGDGLVDCADPGCALTAYCRTDISGPNDIVNSRILRDHFDDEGIRYLIKNFGIIHWDDVLIEEGNLNRNQNVESVFTVPISANNAKHASAYLFGIKRGGNAILYDVIGLHEIDEGIKNQEQISDIISLDFIYACFKSQFISS